MIKPIQELVVTQYQPRHLKIDCATQRAAEWAIACKKKCDVLGGLFSDTYKEVPVYFTLEVSACFDVKEAIAYIENAPWTKEPAPVAEIHVRLSNDTGGRTLVVDTASERAQRHAWECLKKFSSWAYSGFERSKQQVIRVSPCYDLSEVISHIKNVPGVEELVVSQYKPGCFQIDCASERASKWASECQRKFDVLPGWHASAQRSYYTIHIAPRFSTEEVEAYIKNAPWLRELRAVKHGAGILVYAESERASQWALECQRKFGTFVNEVNMKDFFINASPLWNTDAVLEYINNPTWPVDKKSTVDKGHYAKNIRVVLRSKAAEDWLRGKSHYFDKMWISDGQYPKGMCLTVHPTLDRDYVFEAIAKNPLFEAQ